VGWRTGRPDEPEEEEERADEPTGRDADATETPGETSDPAPTADATEPETNTGENGRHGENHAELSEKQLKALRLVERNPGASQGEVAEEFDVTRATVSRWLNDIPGFEWARRAEHAAELLDGGEIQGPDDPVETARFEALARRLDAVERRLEEVANDETATEQATGDGFAGLDPELAHRIVHASMNSDCSRN